MKACKETKLLSLCFLLVVLAVPSAQAQGIASVVRTGTSAQPIPVIASAPLTEGSVCYNDRTHVYASVPTEILGAQYVQVSQGDKSTTDYTLTVTMSADATLYLFLDNRLGNTGGGQGVDPDLPEWMSWVATLGFADTGSDIGIDELADGSINNYSSVFSKQVNAGDVIALGVQNDGGARSMYAGAAMPSTSPRATNPSPANMAIDVPTDVVLGWTPGVYAATHDVYLGTVFEDVDTAQRSDPRGVLVSQNQMANTYAPILEYGHTYYWRIDEVSEPPDSTMFKGNVWSFTTQGQGEGNVLFEYFWGTDGTLESLLNLPTFPDSPDQSELRTSFEGPINWRDNYGTRVRGYLYPPETGNYTFWIASDDQSQLWLSTDEDPANAAQIASVPGWTPPRDFDNTRGGVGGPEQKSSEITLEAGRRYYLEALHSEGWAGDNLAVAWQGPSITIRAIISGTFLSPWIRDIDFKANNPSPPDGATLVATDVTLGWTPGTGAISHHIYFGVNQADVADGIPDTDRGAVPETTYTPGTLANGTTYFWRIDEFDGATTHPGNVWRFMTEPVGYPISPSHIFATASSCVLDMSPHKTIDGSGLNASDQHGTTDTTMWLSSDTGQQPTWIQYQFDKVYNLYKMWVWNFNAPSLTSLGLRSVKIDYSADGLYWTPLSNDFQFSEAPGTDNYAHNTEVDFNGALAQHVRLTANSSWGSGQQYGLSEVRFYYICASATAPNPPDESTGVPTDVVLSWTPGTGVMSHHIYLGTDQGDVAGGTGGTDMGTQTETTFAPGGLAYGTTYYWRVDEVDGGTACPGNVWSFTTTGMVAPPISIPTDTSVGTWDPVTRTYTLTRDVPQCLQIDEDNLTLDGAAHRVIGPGSDNGVNLFGRTEVTLRNLRISQFQFGICLWSCSNCTVTGNTCTSNNEGGILTVGSAGNELINNICNFNNAYGININHSDNNTLTGNTNESNTYFGIHLYYANGNTLTGNTNNSNDRGITLYGSESNTLTGNSCQSNRWVGIHLYSSTGNTMESNTFKLNNADGIFLENSTGNTLTRNTVSNNGGCGIHLIDCSGNQVYHNNIISNPVQAYVEGSSSSGNVFNLDKPSGGNYWSDWTTPDADHDGFVDSPYVFVGGQDNLPWTRQDYWLSADSDGVSDGVEDGAPNGGDGNRDGTPDSQQDNVASLPNAADGQYVTLVSPEGTELENVTAGGNPSPDDAPPGVEFPVGFLDFAVSGMGVGGSATVTIILPAGQTIETYYKYGPTPDNHTSHWYEFLWDDATQTGAKISDNLITLYFVDGQRGDDDLEANGRIVEPGGPGLVLNHPPVATITGPSSGFAVPVGTPVMLSGGIQDPDEGDTHTAKWTISAESWPEPRVVDGAVSGDLVTGEVTFAEAGIYSIALTVTDAAGASDTATTVNGDTPAFVVVYDPDGGFVTGGGWIWSPKDAYAGDPGLEGKATFGFNSKYQKGANVPTGNTEFQFKTGNLNFHSSSYDWLVVNQNGSNAQFKGSGTINGAGAYEFMLWAGDGDPDTFRIKIWSEGPDKTEAVVYDNGSNQPIGGGSIMIHTK